jgi:anti-sigma-K factor RskA
VDIQAYISSGIIEAYVLGIASEEEVRELKLLSAQYPEVASAIQNYQSDLEEYTRLHALPVPEGLKEEIWSVLEKVNTPALPPVPEQDTVKHIKFRGNKASRSSKFLSRSLAAAVALLIGSTILNIQFWSSSRGVEQELNNLKTEQAKIAAANQAFRQQLEQSQKDMQLFLDPSVRTVPLAGVGTHTGSTAMVLWDTRTKEVYLSLKNLPPPPSGKQYQLWAIVDGKPVSAGTYATDSKEIMQKMTVVPSAQMFAITLEKEGGSEQPTLEEMYVAGKT